MYSDALDKWLDSIGFLLYSDNDSMLFFWVDGPERVYIADCMDVFA